jgi:4-amino-4-deoxy-L-arabinose transferase-like glycosyltransferase
METTTSSTPNGIRQRAWLGLVLLGYVLLASFYSFVVPLGEGPDEPGHAMYAFFLAREGRLPVQCSGACQSDVPGEGHQPPLAYALAAPALAWLPREERSFDLPGNRRFVWSGGSETNAVAHGSREFWPWRGEVLGWHLARLVSVALGLATITFTFLAARALGVCPWLAALLLALNPQFLFISALITNDALLAALCALLLWLVVRPEAGGRRAGVWRAAGLGLVLGLALLTKQSALLRAPVVVLWACVGTDGGRRAIGDLGGRMLAAFSVAAAVSGWWFVRNWQLYGDPLGLAVFQAEFATQPFQAGRWQAWLDGLALLHESFWARFGWMNVPAPRWIVAAFTLLEVAALVGVARRLASRASLRRVLAAYWPLALLPVLALAWVVSFALSTGLVAWQGRLLFPALPAIAIVLAGGLASFGGRVKLRAAGWLLPLAMVAGALWLALGVIRPAYPFQTVPEQLALERIGTPVYGRFAARPDEQGAELRGVELRGRPQSGQTIAITLWWHALGRQNRAWWVFIHLVDAQGMIVAEDNREPRDGAFRMSLWSKGDWVEDDHQLRLPDLAPGTYRLRVGLWYPVTDGRAAMFDKRGKLRGDALDVATIVITK